MSLDIKYAIRLKERHQCVTHVAQHPIVVTSYSFVECRKAGGGFEITASHNLPSNNGFKVCDPYSRIVALDGAKEIEGAILSIAECLVSHILIIDRYL